MITDYVKKIGIYVILAVVCFCLGYFYKTSKTTTTIATATQVAHVNTQSHQVTTTHNGTTTTTIDTLSTTDSVAHSNSFTKEEINARKYDLLISYGRDIDSGNNIVGGQFIFEPFSHILIGAGYFRNIDSKSNTMIVSTGLRF